VRWVVDQLKVFWAKYRRVAFRLARDAVMPTCAGIIWGMVVWGKKGSAVDGLNGAILAFFLILSFQNLVQRAAKVIFDEEHGEKVLGRLDLIDQGFGSLQQAMEALRRQGIVAQQPLQRPPSPIRSQRMIPLGYDAFFDEAVHALDNGQHYAAALTAAVGFERAAREAADQIGIDGRRMSLGRLVSELGRRSEDPSAVETFITLNKLRNSLVHAKIDGPFIQREQAVEFVNAFGKGVSILDQAA
jgi:hypothetical protein